MIEGHDLELFERSLRNATEQHTGDALDAALAELGWHDALSFDPRAAVSRLFELQGEARATSSALDHVVAFAIGRELDGRDLGRAAGDRAVARARTARRRTASPCAAWPPRSGRRRWWSPTPATGTWPRWSTRRRSRRGRCTASIRGWASSRSTARSTSTGDTAPVDWARGVALRAARARARARRRVAESARAGARARARTHPVRPADRAVPGGPPPPGRHARRDRDRGRGARRRVARSVAGHRGHGQGDRRAQRAHRRPSLPAGARRHRLHHRARPAPLRAAHPRARPALRLARDR